MDYDDIIVGAGSAGCVLANRLSADPARRVLLIEAGARDWHPYVHMPAGLAKLMELTRYNWNYLTEPQAALDGRRLWWPRGKLLGGSSSINAMCYVRGRPADYARWARITGDAGWDWPAVLPYFKRAEDNTRGADAWHGTGGPLGVSDLRHVNPLSRLLLDAAQAAGFAHNDDFNGASQEGVGYFQLATRKGWRCSTAVAYLRPAQKRPNLRVETDAQVTDIVFEGGRAAGVRYEQSGKVHEARAAREVIVAAGALQSPQLLQLSGIGDGARLQALGIPVIRHLPGVGENLQDHLQLRLMYKVAKPITTNDELRTLWGQARMGLKWLLHRRGPLAIGINQGGLFTRVLPESRTPDIQFHFATVSAEMAGAKPHPWSGCTFSVCQLRPESRGRVFIKSRDAQQPPAMQPNYLSHETDRRCALAATQFARRLAGTTALRPYLAEEYRPGPAVNTDHDLIEWAREYGATIFHPSGTCKMGSDPMAVVDARLRVHGVGGLRVVDCSVMPTLVSGNTNSPVVMIAEKAADMILADAAR